MIKEQAKDQIKISDLIDKSEVQDMYNGISNTTLYRRVKLGQIPPPISWPPNTHTKMWVKPEVEKRIAADLALSLSLRNAG